MGDFIRYIFTGEHDVTLDSIEAALKSFDEAFSIFRDQSSSNSGDVLHESEVYGEIEINNAGDQVFKEDLEDLREQIADGTGDDAEKRVLEMLSAATGMVALQLSETGHEQYRRIDPLWDWLFEQYAGVLQIDEEGYYSQNEMILAVE